MKNIIDLKLFLENVDTVLLKTKPNVCDYYSYNCFDNKGKHEHGVFKTFDEMYDFFYDLGFRRNDTLTKAIIMKK